MKFLEKALVGCERYNEIALTRSFVADIKPRDHIQSDIKSGVDFCKMPKVAN